MWYNISINAGIIKFIQSFSNPFLDKLFQGFTMLGEEYFFLVVLAAIYWCINKGLGYRIGFMYLSSVIVNSAVKDILMVPRPIGEPGIRSLRIETATGWAFPSGHTQGAATFWISLMTNIRRKWIYIIGSIVIFLVGISRLYLGVHWPTDVLGGLFLGILWVLIIDRIFNYLENGGSKTILIVFAALVIAGLFVFKNDDFYKASGTVLSFLTGYVVEPKYIDYRTCGNFFENALKLVIGLGIAMAIRILVKIILPQSILSDFIRYFLMGIWITIGATWFFTKLFKTSRNTFIERV